MEQQFEHLSDAQIESYGESMAGEAPGQPGREGDPAVEAHLAACGDCRTRVLEHQRSRLGIMSSSYRSPERLPSNPDQHPDPVAPNDLPAPAGCPSQAFLRDLAAGLIDATPAAQLTRHAAQCDRCGPLLRAYTEDFADDLSTEDQALLNQLNSASPSWQKKMARQMANAVSSEAAGSKSAAAAPARSSAFSSKASPAAGSAGAAIPGGTATPGAGTAGSPATPSAAPPRSPAKPGAATAGAGMRDRSAARERFPFRLPSLKWIFVPATAVAAAVVAFLIWNSQRVTPEKVEKLLAQAYTEQRTMEMRFPGAEWSPIRVERANGESQLSQPESLLEAEFLITRKLQEQPNSAALLKAKAEAELFAWNYQAAIATLETALRSAPESPELLQQLGVAYYESAERGPQEYSQQEYASALENMSAALKQEPQNPTILFNRAIIQEKMSLLNQAIADWQRFLAIEKDEGWRKEAEKHLVQIRRKQQSTHSGALDDRAPPDRFPFSSGARSPIDPEIALESAERNVLPSIVHADSSDPQFKIADEMARYLASAHDDRFLGDMLAAARQPGFRRAINLLGRASIENEKGEPEAAYSHAGVAVQSFQEISSEAGISAALFEQAYALQFQSKAVGCRRKAEQSFAIARRHGYRWLEIQSSIEQAICANMEGDLNDAMLFCDTAIQLATRHRFASFYLRGLLLRSALKDATGDSAGALADSHAGLERYFQGGIPDLRAYSFYDLISEAAEKSGFAYLRLAAALEQASFFPKNPNVEVIASARLHIANIALELGESSIAETQSREAARILVKLPNIESVRWRLLEANIGLARAQLTDPMQRVRALATLESFSGDLRRIKNRYVEEEYFTTLGEIDNVNGHISEAEKALRTAIDLAEKERKSAKSLEEAQLWGDQNARPYLLLTELLFDSEHADKALALWENFKSSPFHYPGGTRRFTGQKQRSETRTAPSQLLDVGSDRTTVTYALERDEILIWADGIRGKTAVKVSVPVDVFRKVTAKFMDECSHPDSSISQLSADSHLLYKWLINPVKDVLPSKGELNIRPDGILQVLPWEALLNDSNIFLKDQYTIAVSPTFSSSLVPLKFKPSASALIVNGPGLPGVNSETTAVAGVFTRPTLLQGAHAKSGNFERELARHSVLHFVGHAVQELDGPGLVLADGVFIPSRLTKPRDHDRDLYGGKLQLAVLSACSTAGSGYANPSQTAKLVQSFLASGTQVVIATRWNIDSTSTAEFMTAFYQNLVIKKLTVPEALRSASAAMVADSDHSHPYYWAAFAQFTGR